MRSRKLGKDEIEISGKAVDDIRTLHMVCARMVQHLEGVLDSPVID